MKGKVTQLKAFTRQNVTPTMSAIKEALATLGEEYGFTIEQDGNGRFTAGQLRMKLNFNIAGSADVATFNAGKFPRGYPLTDEYIGREVTYGAHRYRIAGYDAAPRITKRVMLTKVSDGSGPYRLGADDVLSVLGAPGAASDTRTRSNVYPGDWEFKAGEPFNDYAERTDKMLAAIPADKMIGFPVGDGRALYYVESLRPLRLQHIPYGDGYQISAAHLRGLRPGDVEHIIANNKAISVMFTKKVAETNPPPPAGKGSRRKRAA